MEDLIPIETVLADMESDCGIVSEAAKAYFDIHRDKYRGEMKMNDKLITKAVECYTEKLEKENVLLKKILRQISNTFGGNAKGRTDRELLDDVLNILMYYNDVIGRAENDTL